MKGQPISISICFYIKRYERRKKGERVFSVERISSVYTGSNHKRTRKEATTMNVSNHVGCRNFPCTDIVTQQYTIPGIDIDPEQIKILVVSEVPPQNAQDYFYATDNPFYLQTTVQAFTQAGAPVSSIEDILNLGVYITTAVKCGKTGYSISAKTIKNCSEILEKEIGLFPNVKAFLLMGDVAIKAINYIAKRETGKRAIPSGSTYKIRKNEFFYKGKRVFPSYLQTGKNFLIEKSKRKMIAEDIKAALELLHE